MNVDDARRFRLLGMGRREARAVNLGLERLGDPGPPYYSPRNLGVMGIDFGFSCSVVDDFDAARDRLQAGPRVDGEQLRLG